MFLLAAPALRVDPRRTLPIFLASGATICLPAPAPIGIRPFEYANNRLDKVSAHERGALLLAAERMLDQALAYLLGEVNEHALFDTNKAFYAQIRELRTGARPPRATNSKYSDLAQQAEQQRQIEKDAGDARRLAVLLRDWCGLDVTPTKGVYETEDTRYRLKPWYNRDGLLVEKRAPGRFIDWRASRIAFSKGELVFAVADLNAEIARAVEKRPRVEIVTDDDPTPAKTRSEKLQARIDKLNAEAREAAKRGFYDAR